jgi:anti-sigma B factor antagonist
MMKVKITENVNAVIIRLEGELMLGSEANDFHEAIRDCVEKNKRNVIVDLSAVRFISSWGIGMLIHGYTTAQNSGTSFKLAAVPDMINETFRKIKVDNVFPQFNSVEEALKR